MHGNYERFLQQDRKAVQKVCQAREIYKKGRAIHGKYGLKIRRRDHFEELLNRTALQERSTDIKLSEGNLPINCSKPSKRENGKAAGPDTVKIIFMLQALFNKL